jgi:hypothetical protein
MKFNKRNIELTEHRLNIDGFKDERKCEGIYIGTSFKRKDLKLKDIPKILKLIFMPYKWIDKQFLQHKI